MNTMFSLGTDQTYGGVGYEWVWIEHPSSDGHRLLDTLYPIHAYYSLIPLTRVVWILDTRGNNIAIDEEIHKIFEGDL